MKKRQIFLILLLFSLLLYLLFLRFDLPTPSPGSAIITPYPSAILPSKLEGPFKVIQVLDGDTIEVEINASVQKIRFVGLDTPEVQGPNRSAMCFGADASAKTKELLSGQSVYLETDSPINLIDKYDRLLRYIYRTSDNLFISKYLVEFGYATEYSYQGVAHKYQSEFRRAQETARSQIRGLWNPRNCATPPNPHF